MLSPEKNINNLITCESKDIKQPFTQEEISTAAKKLKIGRYPDSDVVKPKLIKYTLIELHYKIARIFNSVASKGDHIEELILGLQRPQEKPGKSKGAPENLTTIILF